MMQEAVSVRRGLALVCALALVGFSAWSWPLALHGSTHTLILEKIPAGNAADRASQASWDLLLANDQTLSLWNTVENARAFAGGRWGRLVRQGQCYPMPRATLLGEHMIETGALATPWWVISGDPVVAYNLSLVTALVIAAAGMFLFLRVQFASTGLAVVGGLVFAFATGRLVDLPYHPAVIGTQWIPWVLLAFDRVMDAARVRDVALFALVLLMSGLVGSYPLLAIAIVGACYASAGIVQRAKREQLRIPALAGCVVGVLPAVALVGCLLLAYSTVQQDWVLAVNSGPKFLVDARDYLPGGLMSAGLVALAGLIPLMLLRRQSPGGAVPGLLSAVLATFLLTTRLPLGGEQGWSLFERLATWFPLLDSVRAPGKAGLAVCFGLQALGMIGWGRLLQRTGGRGTLPLAVVLILVTAIEAVPPPAIQGALGLGARMQLREVAPPATHVEAIRTALGDRRDRRAVLDLPVGRMAKAPKALLDAAYHGHPTSACYNSLIPPTMRAAYAMSGRSHTQAGVAELAAAGFGYVIERRASPSARLSITSVPPPAHLVIFEEDFAVWRLPHPSAIERDVSKLSLEVTGGGSRSGAFAPDPPHEIDVVATNNSNIVWASARPLSPVFAEVELASADGAVVFRSKARGVLPLAIAPGESATMQLVMTDAPAPGAYDATVRSAGLPQLTVASGFRWSGDDAP